VVLKASGERLRGTTRDVSLGGVFIETTATAPFGEAVTVHVHVPGEHDPFALQGVVRWTSPEGMGVQLGLMGARETHALTEIVARSQR